MAKTTSRLGKGLNALIPSRDAVSTPAHAALSVMHVDRNQVRHLPTDGIVPNRNQPRTTFDETTLGTLAESVRSKGVLQPIVVRSVGEHAYEIVAGERRWRAAKLAGLPTIPALVREFSDAESLEIALVENLQREDLAPLERAAAYQHYLDAFGGTIEGLAQRLDESRANVSNYLRLLKLRPEICFMLGRGELGMGHARAIAGITDEQRQLAVARVAARRNLSVRQVEQLARAAEAAASTSDEAAKPQQGDGQRKHLAEVEQALTKAVGLRVRLRSGRRKNSGQIIISYASLDEFDHIVERLGASVNLE